ncbi:hypothetical protein INT48_004555 [Thamnidium elegans]|uniref:Actin cytoskeleton-regulatory complex protein PAN1 n=1 Tax=Thamnidium elegans TaxID=101142 RepID=A0A8H7VZZ8_9FUNG|nr:hypothetical protein INT48_004555 [Thamnidium elegans]
MYNNNGGQTGPSKGIRLSFLTPTDQLKFEQIFSQSAAAFGGNKISANAVSELLRRSNLDNDSLVKIWDLASISSTPYLTFPEFAVAMFLTSKKLTGQVLPASLPPNVREETELAMATIASTETSQQLVNTQPQQQQQQFVNAQAPMMTGMLSQQPGMMSNQPSMMQPHQTGMMSNMMPQQTGIMQPQQTGMMASQQMNMMTGINMNNQLRATPPPVPQLPTQTGYMGQQVPMQTGFMPSQAPKSRLQNLDFAKKMMPNQNGVTNLLHPNLGTTDANRVSWKISPEDKQRYRDIFNAWEGSGSGFMSGDTAKDVLTQSQLPPQDLMKIWNLADSENRGSLDLDEFSVAMHLVYRKLNGFEIPNTLPAELKPPSSLLKKFVLGRRPPPSTPSFQTPSPKQEEYSVHEQHHDDYVSNSRRKGPQSASSSRYNSRYTDASDDVDVAILEDLRRQISETKRTLDRIPVSRNTPSSNNSKYSLEELKEKIRRTQDELTQLARTNPLSNKYIQNSDTLLELLEEEKSLQDEIQYLCNRDIPILARQLRGAAAELRDTKVRHSRKNDGTQDFMAFIQPTGPGGSVSESDRVRAKAKAMMAARKAGNSGSSTDAAYTLRRAEEEKEEADKKADSIERDMERSRTALLDMRGDLRYLEEMTAAQDLEDKKRFETGGQDLSYELRRFIEQLDSKGSEPSSYAPRHQTFERSVSSGYQSPSTASPLTSSTPSPKPKATPARPRTADEIKKEAERRVQERLAALQAKRNPNSSPRSIPKSSTPPVSKPDESEGIAQQRLRDNERMAQESLRNSVDQREETDRKNRETELERIRENDRLQHQRSEELEREQAERFRKESEDEKKRAEQEEQEEREFLERRRKVLEKEETDRQARFDAIRRDEEENEQRKKEHKPEEAPSPAAAPPPPPPPPPAPTAAAVPAAPPTPPVAAAPPTPNASTSSNNPFAKFQQASASPVGSSQAEKPNEPANKRVSYNPFAAFSAFSATKGAKDDTDSEDDGWDAGHDDSDDENEFPAAGSAKNLAGMLFTAMSKRGNNDSLETVREVPSPKPDENDATAFASSDIPPPPPAPPAPTASNASGIPPPPAAPAAPAAPTAFSTPPPPTAGGDMRGALLGQIQSGLKLRKANTNDRSASSVSGHVIDDTSAPVQPAAPAAEFAAPAPISGALSSGGFLAELQARTSGDSPASSPAAASESAVDNTPSHDESLPEHGSGADDLVFSQDDIIIVRDNSDTEDWWFADPELNIKAKALYDFEGPEGQGCLSFKMGDTVTVLVKENDDWWKAQSEDGTQVGLVPANYLELS